MEQLPVEVIGNILSRLRSPRHVVVASATCKKWREAFQHHLSSLTFPDLDFSPMHYRCFTSDILASIITQTIRQTEGLQCLKFFLNDVDDDFSADHVFVWLMHARDTLRELHLRVNIDPSINILEKCPRQRLEVLHLAHLSISAGAGSCQKFPCLKTLWLEDVSASALDFCFLLSLLPKIENLTLMSLDVDSKAIMSLNSVSLKTIDVVDMDLGKFILKADSLEYLHLQMCNVEHFELIGKGTLKVLNIDATRISSVDVRGNMENLEIVDVNESSIKGPKLYNLISKSSNLRRLRLWRVKFDNADEVIDLESISASFPQLTQLSLYSDVEETHFSLQGSSHLQNVAVLELGFASYNGFSDWIAGVMERCPNLKKIIIYRFCCEEKISEDLEHLAEFSLSIVRMARKHLQVEFQFKYE